MTYAVRTGSILCSLIAFLHCMIFVQSAAAQKPPHVKVAVQKISKGKAIGPVEANTPAYLIDVYAKPPIVLQQVTVDAEGFVEFDVIPDKSYELIVDTLHNVNKPERESCIPCAVSIRTSLPRVGAVPLGTWLVAEAREVADFGSTYALQSQLNSLERTMKGSASAELTDCWSRIVKRQRELEDVRASKSWMENSSVVKRLLMNVNGNLVKVSGYAASSINGKWVPYAHCHVWAITAEGTDVAPICEPDTTAKTNHEGYFSLKLPQGFDIRLIVDVDYKHPGSRRPAVIDLCPLTLGDKTYDEEVAVTNSDQRVPPVEESYQNHRQIMTAVKDKAKNLKPEQQSVASKRAEDSIVNFRAVAAAQSRLNIVAPLFGDAPDEDWARLLAAAKEPGSKTVYWAIVKPGQFGVVANWEQPFRKYIDAQFIAEDGVPQSQLLRSNFRMVGYLSLWGNAANPKPAGAIREELKMWASKNQQNVTGVFLDNLWHLSESERDTLFTYIKTEYGNDFHVFGACGPPVNNGDTEVSAAKFVDTLFIEKTDKVEWNKLLNRFQGARKKPQLGVMNFAVTNDDWPQVIEEFSKSPAAYIGISNFKPQADSDKWFDARMPLPPYWEKLAERVEALNQVKVDNR